MLSVSETNDRHIVLPTTESQSHDSSGEHSALAISARLREEKQQSQGISEGAAAFDLLNEIL